MEFLLLYTTIPHTSTTISATNITTATPTAGPIITPVFVPSLLLPAVTAEVITVDGVALTVYVEGTGNDVETCVDVAVITESSDANEESEINVDINDIDVGDIDDDADDIDIDDIDIDVDNT